MTKLVFFAALISLLGCAGSSVMVVHAKMPLPSTSPERIMLGDTELHYVTRGTGEVVVLIHGSLADHTYWEKSNQITPLAKNFRVIAYSRRYNYPNRNQPGAEHSATVEADDLARFLERIGAEHVYLVGHS